MMDLKAEAERIAGMRAISRGLPSNWLETDIESLCKRYADEKLEEAAKGIENLIWDFPKGTDQAIILTKCFRIVRQLKSGEGKEIR